MELKLIRAYFDHGTNGMLMKDGVVLCRTIELPWKENEQGISCIPEGKYLIQKRYSEHLGWHLIVKDVPHRDLILIHPANDALKELKGCIAPVSLITGEGKGSDSRVAMAKVISLVYPVIEKEEVKIWIIGSK
jgi:hypothetical protein